LFLASEKPIGGKGDTNARRQITNCPNCGAMNRDGDRLCRTCGKPLELSQSSQKSGDPAKELVEFRRKDEQGAKKSMAVTSGVHRTIPDKLRYDYAHSAVEPVQKSQEGIQSLLAHFRNLKIDIDALLQETANLISKQYGIADVAIGLRDPKDGLYRYKAMAGFRDDALKGHKTIVYTKEQFSDGSGFKGNDISKYSRIYLEEDNVLSEEERKTYNRPGLFARRRPSASESLEGDYIDVKILGVGEDLLGWIEISGTRTMKLPDITTIRWVEVIASILAAALVKQVERAR
jgi:uncharacterized Zn finger protein (UPF0148 family)